MKTIQQTVAGLALCAASGLAAAANDAALYSFADVYRLTVGSTSAGTSLAASPQAATPPESPIRAVSLEQPARYSFSVSTPAPIAGGYAFSIGAMPEPGRWLLFLSGLAAAAWVA